MAADHADIDGIDEIVAEFVVECREILDELDTELVRLEHCADPDLLARIFRATHTVKGTAGFLGMATLESVTHVGENLLSKLRDGELEVSSDIVSALLAMFDAVRQIVERIAATGAEGDAGYPDLIARLAALDSGASPVDGPVAAAQPVAEPIEATPAADPAGSASARTGSPDAGAEPAVVDTPVVESATTDTIRVDVELLDELMNLVGELVLARNQILQHTTGQHDAAFTATSQRLNLITTELQEGVMRTRMQPIDNVWNKFPRVVRDLTLALDKQATLVMEGKHTELDKTLLEAIKDPLTHLVRNAVDHGLEGASERAAAGKPAEGTIRLRAYHEGGQVIIEISDDGRGIDPSTIRRKAIQQGLLVADDAPHRSDREVVNLIFHPGFSTAEAVTNISGRGVGMDIVRTNIEAIGGSVDVHSTPGRGTTFKVRIPLTLAIIPALIVTCDGDRYAIPQVSLLELVRVDAATALEHVHGVPVYRLRGRLLPIVFLSEVFRNGRPDTDSLNIVVVRADDREFGLVVDEINDTAEIVVKPLGRILKQVAAFAGATIMGDGRVALILDVLGIAEHVGMAAGGDARSTDEAGTTEGVARRLLMLRVGERRLALPLDMVARLEEFPDARLEQAGGRQVVQYRDEILHLVQVADELGEQSARHPGEPLQVVVYREHERSVGVVVDAIEDIVEAVVEIRPDSRAHGTVGSAVIQGQVTDVLDVAGLLRTALPTHADREAA